MSRVLVTDASRGSAVAVIRSLGMRGHEVIAADSRLLSAGLRSRYAAARLRYPDPVASPFEAVESLASYARESNVDLVFPVGEELVVLLSDARDRFAGSSRLALPDRAALDVARDKHATLELARAVGVPTPRTHVVRTASEALRVMRERRLDWPVVLKPQASRKIAAGRVDALTVAYAADEVALEREMRGLERRCAVLLQEHWPGEGHGVGVVARDGVVVLAFQHRRLREVPTTGGPSSLRESVALDDRLLDDSTRLLAALRWNGPAMVEFKVGPAGRALMEVNGRLWGSLPLAVKSGVDIPAAAVDVFLERDGPSHGRLGSYRLGVTSRDVRLELSWISSVLGRPNGVPLLFDTPRRREALGVALRLLDPRPGFDVMSRQDPLPGLVGLADVALTAPARLARRRAARR